MTSLSSFLSFSPTILVALVLIVPSPTTARCFFREETVEDAFATSGLIFHLQGTVKTSDSDIHCPVSYFDLDQGRITTASGIPRYEILQVLKQDWSAWSLVAPVNDTTGYYPGDTLPILYSTDTGLVETLPSNLVDDPNGFIAYVLPNRVCENTDNLKLEVMPTNVPLMENAYTIDACSFNSKGWSELTNEERAFYEDILQQNNETFLANSNVPPGTNWTTTTPDTSDVDLENTLSRNIGTKGGGIPVDAGDDFGI